MNEDLGKEPFPVGENNIAFINTAGRRARGVVVLDSDGNEAAVFPVGYGVYKIDADASPNFYGFQKANGSWVIMKETLATGNDVYEFLKGSSDIASSWATRVSNSYDTFENTF